MAHAFSLSTWEAEVCKSLWFQSQLCLQSEFQDRQKYRETWTPSISGPFPLITNGENAFQPDLMKTFPQLKLLFLWWHTKAAINILWVWGCEKFCSQVKLWWECINHVLDFPCWFYKPNSNVAHSGQPYGEQLLGQKNLPFHHFHFTDPVTVYCLLVR